MTTASTPEQALAWKSVKCSDVAENAKLRE
jgi:hypothetical protein